MSKLDEFFNGSLVSWIKSLVPEHNLIDYNSLINGDILNKVWNLIDPQSNNNQFLSSNQFTILVHRMKSFYEDRLGQIILTLPDCAILRNSPQSLKGLDQIKLLLKLFLGAAVQCPRKEYFIKLLTKFNVETQFSLVDYIKKVTDNESFVLTSDSSKRLSAREMFNNLRRVTKERSLFNSNFLTEIEIIMNNGKNSRNFLEPKLLELNGIKSQIRKIREQFEEKCEDNNNLKEDLKFQMIKCEKLKTDNQKCYNEAKLVSIYRNEIEYYKERSDRTDRLEIETAKNREKLNDLEFYKTIVIDLREDYQLLLDEKQNLEVKLEESRKQNEEFFNLKYEALEIKEKYEKILSERKNHEAKFNEMNEINNELKLALNENNSRIIELDTEIFELNSRLDLSEQSNKEKGRENLSLKLVNSKLIERLEQVRFDHQSQFELFKKESDTKIKVNQFQERESFNTCSDLKLENDFKSLSKEVVKKSFGSNLFKKFRKSQIPCLQNKYALNAEIAGSRKPVYIINEEEEILGHENVVRTSANDSIMSAGWEEFGCV